MVTELTEPTEAPSGQPRVAVVGPMGAGKTTLAREIAGRLRVPWHSLDDHFWLPGWRPRPEHDFQRRIDHVIDAPAWAVDTFSSGAALDKVCRRATAVIWLDLPMPLCGWRVLRRTIGNIRSHAELCGANHDTWGRLFSRQSAPLTAVRRHRRHRARTADRLGRATDRQLTVVRLTSRAAVARLDDSVLLTRGTP